MEHKRLKDIAKITMGQSPDSSSYNNEKDGLPFFQGNADFGELYPNERFWCNAPKKVAMPGDILISVRAPIGALNYAKGKSCIGRGLAAITIENIVERNYIFHLLKARNNYLNSMGTGSTFKAIGKNVLEEILIPQISREEQQKCVNMMDLLGSIIRERQSQLGKFDEIIRARFVELFGDLVEGDKIKTNRQKIGSIASVTKLAGFEFTKYIKYKDIGSRDDVIMLRGLNCKRGQLILDNIKWIDRETSNLLPRSKLYIGDILITYAGTIGDVALVDEDNKYHLAPNVGKITLVDKSKYNPVFLVHLLMYTNEYIMSFSSKVAQASINMQKIRDFEYYFPNYEEQKYFADFATQVNKSKVEVQRALDETQLLFDSLMQKYFG